MDYSPGTQVNIVGINEMPKKRTRIKLVCPNCKKEFEIIRSRLEKSKNHYCSLTCLSRFTAPIRSKKLLTRKYPINCGVCLNCGKDILAYNAYFVKLNRKYCSNSCKTTYQNKTNNPMNNMESRKKMSISNSIALKGIKRSDETKEKYRLANLGCKSHFWKGGLTDKNRLLRNMAKTKNWRKLVFERDNYTCQICLNKNGNGVSVKLAAHHIKHWSKNIDKRWNLDNGITLCWNCHYKLHSFSYKLNKGLAK